MFKDFQKFLLRGNLVDLAIGFTVGAAFSTFARSLVDDIIMPPIAALMGDRDFSDLELVLRQGEDGPIAIRYGNFINNLITLLLIGLAMYLVIKMINNLDDKLEKLMGKEEKDKNKDPDNKKCPYCYSTIPFKATRCPQCTSKL